MGNQRILSQYTASNHWEIIDRVGYCITLQNQMTLQKVEEHMTKIMDISLQKQYYQIYEWRQAKSIHANLHLVQVLELTADKENFAQEIQVKVITEKIYRLSELCKISKAQGLLLLEHFIIGCLQLYNNFGVFEMNANILGINSKGCGKVWLNENYAKTYAQNTREKDNFEFRMVNSLINLIRQKVYNNQLGESYPWSMNFVEALKYLEAARQLPFMFIDKIYKNRSEFVNNYHHQVQLNSSFNLLKPQFIQFQSENKPQIYSQELLLNHQIVEPIYQVQAATTPHQTSTQFSSTSKFNKNLKFSRKNQLGNIIPITHKFSRPAQSTMPKYQKIGFFRNRQMEKKQQNFKPKQNGGIKTPNQNKQFQKQFRKSQVKSNFPNNWSQFKTNFSENAYDAEVQLIQPSERKIKNESETGDFKERISKINNKINNNVYNAYNNNVSNNFNNKINNNVNHQNSHLNQNINNINQQQSFPLNLELVNSVMVKWPPE